MDWDLAIKRNSEALAEIVADLFTMLGLVSDATVARLPWQTYRAVLRVLRPAESALRRLIVVAARGLVVHPSPSRRTTAGAVKPKKTLRERVRSFQLFDPRTRIMLPRRRMPPRPGPRIHMFNADNELVTVWPPPRPTTPAPAPVKSADGMVSATRIIRRLESLEPVLADVPRQARRLVRWRMRQETSPNPSFKTPLRPGHPPATAGGKFTRSTSCSASATGWPVAPRWPIRAEENIISIRINMIRSLGPDPAFGHLLPCKSTGEGAKRLLPSPVRRMGEGARQGG